MSRWPADSNPSRAEHAPSRRWLRLPGHEATCTLFLQSDAVWRFKRGSDDVQRFSPASEWAAAHAGGNVRLVLSDTLTHQLVVSDPALPIEDADALLAWARHQFVHYHGPAALQWPVSTWLKGPQRGASAAHGIDLDALVRSAAAKGVRLRAVQPWWAVALQAATLEAPTLELAEHAELWLVEALQVTRVVCVQGRVQQIEQHWLERADATALAALMAERSPTGRVLWTLGYGLSEGGFEALPARRLGTLTGERPSARWIGV